jgi:hypothetical protein
MLFILSVSVNAMGVWEKTGGTVTMAPLTLATLGDSATNRTLYGVVLPMPAKARHITINVAGVLWQKYVVLLALASLSDLTTDINSPFCCYLGT